MHSGLLTPMQQAKDDKSFEIDCYCRSAQMGVTNVANIYIYTVFMMKWKAVTFGSINSIVS